MGAPTIQARRRPTRPEPPDGGRGERQAGQPQRDERPGGRVRLPGQVRLRHRLRPVRRCRNGFALERGLDVDRLGGLNASHCPGPAEVTRTRRPWFVGIAGWWTPGRIRPRTTKWNSP